MNRLPAVLLALTLSACSYGAPSIVPTQNVQPPTCSSTGCSSAPVSFRISASIAPCTITGRRSGTDDEATPHAPQSVTIGNRSIADNLQDLIRSRDAMVASLHT